VAAPTAVAPLPVGPQLYFTSDFENGFADWGSCQSTVLNGDCSEVNPRHHSMQIFERPDAPGNKAARFVVEDGDTVDFGGERSELSDDNGGATAREGDERWYEWSMRVAEDFPEAEGNWFIVMQWHSSGGSPPLAIDLSRGTVDIGGDGVDAPRKTVGPIRRGEWVDYVMHVKFSQNADEGFVEAWEDGRKTVSKTARATMTSEENYLKQGIYRDESAGGTARIDFDNLRITGPRDQGEVQPKLKSTPQPRTQPLPQPVPKTEPQLLPDLLPAVGGLLNRLGL